MDLSKLTPAPWYANSDGEVWHDSEDRSWFICRADESEDIRIGESETDSRFCALARNAFDVMMRRGWHAQFCEDADSTKQWMVRGLPLCERQFWRYPDPFTALVDADRWYRENIEKERE